MQQTRMPVAANSNWSAAFLQPLHVFQRRGCIVTAAAAAQFSGTNYQGGVCSPRHRSCLSITKTTLGGSRLWQRRDHVVARFREGESGAAAEAGSPQERPEEDDMLLCRQPGFELCAPGPMKTVPVVFALGKHCQFGHSFGLVGETPELGGWDTSKALCMEWHESDVWQAHALIPVSTPVAFKCVELGPDGSFLGWIQDIAAGDNMTVLAEPIEDFVSTYKVTVDPPMSAEPGGIQPYLTARLDVAAILPVSAAFYERKKLAVAAGMPAADAEDLLTDKALAEQGLMSEDRLAEKWPDEIRNLMLVPDSASDTEGPSLLLQDSSSAATGAAMGAAPDLEGSVPAGLSAAGSLAEAVAAGLMEAGDDETAVAGSGGGSSTSMYHGRMISSVDWYEGGNSSVSSTTEEDRVTSSKFDTSADDEADWVPAGPTRATAADAPASLHRHAKAGQQHHDMHADLSTASSSGTRAMPSSSRSSTAERLGGCCVLPPSNTKLVSASPSVSSVDVDAPLGHPDKAVYEVAEGSLEPVDPIHVEQDIALPGKGQVESGGPAEAKPAEEPQGRHVKVTVDQGTSVRMRGEDPLSLPDVPEISAIRGAQAPGGFVDSSTAVGPDEGLLVPPELAPEATSSSSGPRVKLTVDRPMSVSMRGEDPLSLPDVPELSAMRGAQAPGGFVDSSTAVGQDEGLLVPPELTTPRGFADVQTATGAAHEEQGVRSHEQLPAPPEQATAMGFSVQAERLDSPAAAEQATPKGFAVVQTPPGAQHEAEGVGSHEQLLASSEQALAVGLTAQAEGLDEPTATMSADDQLAAALAAAAAAASTVRYAGGAAAARVEEAKQAVDERSKLMDGADATPVNQVMAEAAVIAAAAKAKAEIQGVQEVAEVLCEAAREKAEKQQNPGEAEGRGAPSGSSIDSAPLQSWGGDSEHVRGSRRSGRGGWLKRLITGKQ